MLDVKPDRGLHDNMLSQWHRRLGWNLPAVDLDYPLIEYDKGLPVALIEYKYEKAQKIVLAHPTFRALSTLAERARLPFFVIRYKGDFSAFHVIPVNSYAKRKVQGEKFLSEAEYVKFLYWLRGYDCPRSILDGLKVVI